MYTAKNREAIRKKWFSGPKVVRKNVVRTCPSEFDDQCQLVKWLTEKGLKFTAIPNASSISYNQANRNTASGLRKGLPDLLIIVKNRLIWIELKRSDLKPKRDGSGGLSQEQIDWIEALNGCDNCSAYVCYGFEEAKNVIENYN